jgi:soluble lytic murein transglycosylase-like protein
MASDTQNGLVEISRNGFALLGLVVVALTLTLAIRPSLQEVARAELMAWLEARQLPSDWSTPAGFAALQRTTAGDPLDLPAEQASVTYWLSRKYNVAPEPLSVLVAEAFELGDRAHIAPTLILAIMAIESNFNPYAQNTAGGQGLMQIQSLQQSDKLDSMGGALATFDPLSNLRVGVRVLHELSVAKGSVLAGLAAYAQLSPRRDSNYLERVLQEEQRLARIAQSVRQARVTGAGAPTKRPLASEPASLKTQSLSL